MTVIINGTTGITSVNGSAAAPSVTGTDTDTGIVYGTNTLSLSTGGVAAVTIDSSQNLTIPQATAAGSNSVSLPPYLSLTGFGWNTSLGSSPIGGRIALTGTYSSPTFGQVSPSLSFSTQDSNGSMTQRAQINAFGIGLGNGTVPSSGTGITFPATASVSSNANTLDDYEEGTWTPILSTDGSGVFTQTTQNGTYTKIGNLVSFSLYIVWSAYSGSGSTQLTNWPFPPYWGPSGSQRQYGFPMKASSASATQGYVFKNDTNGYVSNTYLYTFTDSSIVAASALGSTGWIAVSGQYFTNV